MATVIDQPSRKTSYLAWLLLAAGVVALIVFFSNKSETTAKAGSAQVNASANTGDNNAATTENNVIAGWDGIDFNTSAVQYDEVPNADVSIRSTPDYSIYGMNEAFLFAEGGVLVSPEAEKNLTQVLHSIDKRHQYGALRVYVYTGSQDGAAHNQELAAQRAAAVKAWLVKHGIAAERVSVNAIQEAKPSATSSVDQGMQQDRRVEIVVRNGRQKKSS